MHPYQGVLGITPPGSSVSQQAWNLAGRQRRPNDHRHIDFLPAHASNIPHESSPPPENGTSHPVWIRIGVSAEATGAPKKTVSMLISHGPRVPIISTVRLSALVEILGTKDPSYDGIHIMEWSQIEINIAIIAACLAVLRPFVARLFPSLVNPPSGRDNYHGAVPRSPATARRRSMMMRLQSTSQSQTRASGPELDISLHMHDVEATPVVAGSSEKDSWNGNEVR